MLIGHFLRPCTKKYSKHLHRSPPGELLLCDTPGHLLSRQLDSPWHNSPSGRKVTQSKVKGFLTQGTQRSQGKVEGFDLYMNNVD